MTGGIVVQTVKRDHGLFVELLEEPYSLSRCWRRCLVDADVRIGDRLWWQQMCGYLSRGNELDDEDIGECKPASHPDNATSSA